MMGVTKVNKGLLCLGIVFFVGSFLIGGCGLSGEAPSEEGSKKVPLPTAALNLMHAPPQYIEKNEE